MASGLELWVSRTFCPDPSAGDRNELRAVGLGRSWFVHGVLGGKARPSALEGEKVQAAVRVELWHIKRTYTTAMSYVYGTSSRQHDYMLIRLQRLRHLQPSIVGQAFNPNSRSQR